MINRKKIIVVIPAYNAAKTLVRVWHEIPHKIVDDVVLVDDASTDNTITIARQLKIKHIISHQTNLGYGANQKTCYDKALSLKADIIVMVHADYQYTPKLIHSMAASIAEDVYPVVFGSRMLGKGAFVGKMPWYKYCANKLLTLLQNILLRENLSEFHTGLRAFRSDVISNLPYHNNSDSFIFDNQIALQILYRRYTIGEIACPTHYADDSSTIGLPQAIIYGLQVLWLSIRFRLARWGLARFD